MESKRVFCCGSHELRYVICFFLSPKNCRHCGGNPPAPWTPNRSFQQRDFCSGATSWALMVCGNQSGHPSCGKIGELKVTGWRPLTEKHVRVFSPKKKWFFFFWGDLWVIKGWSWVLILKWRCYFFLRGGGIWGDLFPQFFCGLRHSYLWMVFHWVGRFVAGF